MNAIQSFNTQNLFHKKNLLPLCGFLIACLFIFIRASLHIYTSVDISNSPDETGESLFITHLPDSGSLSIKNNMELNKLYKNVFAPRGAVVNNSGEIVPLKAPLSIYILGVFYLFLSNVIDLNIFHILKDVLLTSIFIIYLFKFIKSADFAEHPIIYIFILVLLYALQVHYALGLYNVFFIY